MISRAEIARRTGLSRSTVSSLVTELQTDGLVVEREETAAAHGEHGGRPPILLSFDASAGAALGIDFGHSHLRVAVSDLVVEDPRRARRAARHRPRRPGGARRRARPHRGGARRGRHRALAGDRRRPRAARPDRPVRRRDRLLGDPARLGRRRRRGGAAPPARRAGQRRQRRQPGRAGRVHARRRPRRDRPRLPQGLLGHRRGPDPRRPPVPRLGRDGRRARPRAGRPRGRGLPLRQPRLPGDRRLDRRAAGHAAPQPRRPDRRRDARPRARGRPRLPPRDRRRRPQGRQRGGLRLQRAQPAAARGRRRPRRGGRPAARRRAQLRAPRGAARGGRRPPASSPACSASAPRCWGRSRWPSARPTPHSIFPKRSTNQFPEGE